MRHKGNLRLRTTPTTGMHRIEKKRDRSPKQRIVLEETSGRFIWTYYVGKQPFATSYRSYTRLSDATKSAISFRLRLLTDCEIVPPEGHKYAHG